MAFVFTLAHGIFVVAIVFLIGENQPESANWTVLARSVPPAARCRCSPC